MKKIILTALLSIGFSANAGVGLGIVGISALFQGAYIGGPVLMGLGAGSIVRGVNKIKDGRIGWGVFWLTLDTEAQEVLAPLNEADADEREACLEIIFDKGLSLEDKQVECAAL